MRTLFSKNNLKAIILHVLFFIVGTIVYLLLLASGVFNGISVYFYRGIAILFLVILSICPVFVLIHKTGFKDMFTLKDAILSVVIIFSFNMLFFTHVPVTADRSVTVFLLGIMAESSDKAVIEKEIEDGFIKEYVYENNNIQKRLDEQVTSGNIFLREDGYVITDQGLKLIQFYRAMVNLLNIDDTNLTP